MSFSNAHLFPAPGIGPATPVPRTLQSNSPQNRPVMRFSSYSPASGSSSKIPSIPPTQRTSNTSIILTPLDGSASHLNTPPVPVPIGSLLPARLLVLATTPHCQGPAYRSLVIPPNNRGRTGLTIDVADSLTREKQGKMPALSHLLTVVGGGRVMSLAVDEEHIYAGCQSRNNEIVVFSRASLQPKFRLLGHEGSVLALLIIEEKGWLVSSSSAGDIRIWCTENLQPVYIIHPCDDTSGDIYSLAWDHRDGGTLYFGSQSCSVEWVNFKDAIPHAHPGPSRTRKPSLPTASASVTVAVSQHPANSSQSKPKADRTGRYRPHTFFDKPLSRFSSGASTPLTPREYSSTGSDLSSPNETPSLETGIEVLKVNGNDTSDTSGQVVELEVAISSRRVFAHYGYVYAMHVISREDGRCWLMTGSGDCDVKLWEAQPGGGLSLIREFSGLNGAVLSFGVRDSLLYAGLQAGEIIIWDLETGACIRTIEAHEADVLTMSVLGGDVYTAAADGRCLRVNEDFDCTADFQAHQGIVLSSAIAQGEKEKWELITAGNDSAIKIWTIDPSRSQQRDIEVDVEGEGDVMLYALSKLVAVPTVSDEVHRESCRQGAHLLKKILSQLGASAEVLSGEQGKNPLVLATFSGSDSGKSRRRVLFYGHYDVQPAAEAGWESDPWELGGRNGYLYGRGVSDNKGPIMAVACAAASLRQKRELDVDVVMLVEGEEEAGSRGFASTVRNHKSDIGHIDAILLSNSTWIGEVDPCVVFGMRGVVYANISVANAGEDAHSGVDGGVVTEPMFDMVRILGAISDNEGVRLPGFHDQVRPQTEEEMQLLSDVAGASHRSVEELTKVWCQPSFSIANITISGSANKTVIPKKVSADISMRIVPDQDLKTIVESLKRFCKNTFADLKSPNHFEITVTHSASWWLASLDSPYFKALEAAVQDVWGTQPLKIREGGTVPTIFWLEQEFKAPCVHLPLGQASDAGHLANERMRLLNLRNGKRVVESYLARLAKI